MARALRVLNVITSMNPKGGGPSEGLRQLARVADRAGLGGMEIVSFDPPGSAAVQDVAVPVHAIGPARGSFQYCPAYRTWLRENAARFDAVLVRGLWQYPGLATRDVLHGTGIPYFVFPHGMLDPWFKQHYPLKHLKKWLYWPWGEYRVLRDAGAVMFTCEEERRLARESFWLYKTNECVINYGTARPQGDPDKQREAFFTQFPELRGKRILLFLSRIHEKKGVDLLIKAFASLLNSELLSTSAASVSQLSPRRQGLLPSVESQLHLVIAGPCADPAYMAHLKQLLSANGLQFTDHSPSPAPSPQPTAYCSLLPTAYSAPDTAPSPQSTAASPLLTANCSLHTVTLPGMLSGDLKWGAFHGAEAFVLPSHQENFGIAVAESLACGLPVLISNKVNIWREIEQDHAGLVAEDTLEGTRELLQRWAALTPEERHAMKAAAKNCFENRFEIGRAAESLHAALSSLINRPSADVHA